MSKDWSEYLFGVFMGCRKSPQWEEIKSLHDIEDQKYFEMLEESGAIPDSWPGPASKRIDKWARKRI